VFFIVYSVVTVTVAIAVYTIYVGGSDRAGVYSKNSAPNPSRSVSTQQARTVCIGQCAASTDVLRGALGAMELAEGSSETQLHARAGRDGALAEDTDALVSLQRLALTGLAEGAAGWDGLLALSLTKTRLTGRDSMKLDREEEDMIVVL
jgi:hypothetical protein